MCESKFCKGNIVYRIMQSAKLFKVLHHTEQKYYMIVHFANCHTLHSFALCILCKILHFALFFYWSSASMDGFSVLLKLHKYDLTKQIGMSNLSCQFLKRLVGFFYWATWLFGNCTWHNLDKLCFKWASKKSVITWEFFRIKEGCLNMFYKR